LFHLNTTLNLAYLLIINSS